MLPIVQTLLSQGLSLLGNAVLAKGEKWVSEKTGVDLSRPDLTSTDFVVLRQAEMDHEEELLKIKQEDNKLFLEIAKEEFKDIANARHLQEIALLQADVFAKRFIYYLAMFWSVFAALYIMIITLVDIPPDNTRFADTILGFILGTIIATIMTFFFGTSRSSMSKDATILEALKVGGSK